VRRLIIHSTLAGLILCGFFGVLAESVAGKWEPKALLLRQRWGLGAETVNGKIYAIGGQDDLPAAGKRVAEYDLGKDQWTEKKSISTGRFRIATGMVRGKIYVFGGTANNFEALPTVEEYDPKTDTWTVKANMPTPRMGFAIAAVGGKIYTIGGAESFFFPSAVVEVYDPVSDTWEKKADMPNPRWGISTVAVASKIYVFGGAVDNTHQKYTDLTEEYNPKTDTWTKKADMPIKFFDMAASFVNSGKAYIIGGKTFDGRDKDGTKVEGWILHWTVLEYDVEKNKWQRLNDEMPTGRGTLASSVVAGKIYVIGGHNNGPRREVEVYTPDGWPFPKAFSVSPQGKLATKWGAIKQRQ
jgi:N-acetylneuraminic acid mutarotase